MSLIVLLLAVVRLWKMSLIVLMLAVVRLWNWWSPEVSDFAGISSCESVKSGKNPSKMVPNQSRGVPNGTKIEIWGPEWRFGGQKLIWEAVEVPNGRSGRLWRSQSLPRIDPTDVQEGFREVPKSGQRAKSECKGSTLVSRVKRNREANPPQKHSFQAFCPKGSCAVAL